MDAQELENFIKGLANGLLTRAQSDRLGKLIALIDEDGGKKRSPQRVSLHIKDTAEKALQRAIYLSAYSDLLFENRKSKRIFWGDAEVPVSVIGKLPRGSCFDLVGRFTPDEYVLCELKNGENGDSPLFAALELFAYSLVSRRRNALCFHKNSIATLSEWKQSEIIKEPTLIVAGDEPYWNAMRKPNKFTAPLRDLLKEITIGFFRIPLLRKDFFQRQRGNKSRLYTPCLGGAYGWNEEIMDTK